MHRPGVRRAAVLSTVMLLTLSLAVPATAKKPTQPSSAPVGVTLGMPDGVGIATDCGNLAMTQVSARSLRVDWVAFYRGSGLPGENGAVYMSLPGIDPGCHGGGMLVVDPPDGFVLGDAYLFDGALILSGGPGDTLELTSRFDYTWHFGSSPNPHKAPSARVDELFEINGVFDGIDWSSGSDEVPQTVRGSIELRRFFRDSNGDPVWETLRVIGDDDNPVTLTITIDWP